jgi:hypothetical protein
MKTRAVIVNGHEGRPVSAELSVCDCGCDTFMTDTILSHSTSSGTAIFSSRNEIGGLR